MNDQLFLETVRAGCEHPGLYTPKGSFFEIVAFLEGYGIGANLKTSPHHSAFTPFLRWIAEIYKTNEPICDWVQFRDMFESDLDACQNLIRLFEEFLRKKKASS